jgi:ATP-dependent protease HslVU (ClpYQ) peptidase subunit
VTCIISFAQDGKIWMGADSCVSGYDGWETFVITQPKVFVEKSHSGEGVLVGVAGSVRVLQLMRYALDFAASGSGAEYIFELTERLRFLLADSGFALNDNPQPGDEQGMFEIVIGYQGAVYTIDTAFQFARSTERYTAHGCGRRYALGALLALPDDWTVPDKIYKALEITAKFNAAVSKPFVIEKI